VGIDDGGGGAVMAEVDLELAKVFPLLQQMGGIAVPQRMNVHGFFDAAGAQGQAEGSLQRGAAHRLGSGGSAQAAVALGGEEKTGMPVGAPDLPEQLQGALRQGHVAVAVAFARPDVEKHAFGINVADFQFEGFTQAQATGIDGRKGYPMIEDGDLGDDGAHFGSREDDRQLELGRGAGELQLRGPGPLEGFLPEEFDGAQRLSGALASEAPVVFEIDEILAEFLGADPVGRAVKVLGELPHTGPVALLTAGL